MVKRPRSALAAPTNGPVNLASRFPLLHHYGVILCGFSYCYGSEVPPEMSSDSLAVVTELSNQMCSHSAHRVLYLHLS